MLGNIISGIFGYKGQKDTNVASAQQAQRQMGISKRNVKYSRYSPNGRFKTSWNKPNTSW